MIHNLIQANFADVIVLVYMYIFLLTNRTLDKDRTRDFFLGCLFVNILIISDSADYYFNTLSYLNPVRYVLGAIGYSTRPAIIAVFLFAVSTELKKLNKIFAVLLGINAVLAFSSFYTHFVFYYDENNNFYRGPLGFMPFLISFIFVVFISLYALQMYRIGDKREMSIMLLIDVMVILSAWLETTFGFYFLINAVAGVSIIFYYLFLHTQTFKRDAMTHALNRHAFYADLEKHEKEECVIVSIDLNNLKQLNDSIGHSAGDEAISMVAKVFLGNITSNGSFYRVGGDEFILIDTDQDIQGVERQVSRIQEMIKREGYEIAWGAAKYCPGMNINKVISESDRKMYEQKASTKLKKIQITESVITDHRKKIGIVTDSASGITKEEAMHLGIKVLPLDMIIGNTRYEDDGTMNYELLFRKIKEEKRVRTEPPTKAKMTELWDEALKEYEQILYIPISRGLSEACANAIEYSHDLIYQNRVFVVDVGRVASAFRRTILDTLEMIKEGYTAIEIKYMLEESRANTVTYIAVQSLKYLYYGNKIDLNTALRGGFLPVKPILKFDIGTIGTYKICFSFDQAKKEMIASMKKELETTFKHWVEKGEIDLVAATSGTEEETQEWIKILQKEFPNMEIVCERLPLCVASYVGAGSVGIGCACKPKRLHD